MRARQFIGGISLLSLCLSFAISTTAAAKTQNTQSYLVKLKENATIASVLGDRGEATLLFDSWYEVKAGAARGKSALSSLQNNDAVEFVQPNYSISLLENYQIQDPLRREAFARYARQNPGIFATMAADNPAIPALPNQATGADPLFSKQWGMIDVGAKEAWSITTGNPDMIVAVIDTGVDYTHEDLNANIWRNPKEIPNNKIDDDGNGYVDDVVGWDFVSNDNKPYDLAASVLAMLTTGGNPGHGTHCAGNVAARGNNGIGIAGVAPNVKIMALRFISTKGQGTTADAVKAIKYAVDNGAKVLSNSWGSEGEDSSEEAENKALRDAIQYAQDHGVLFIAAAGNGHVGVGYDNDTDSKPSYPASYDHDAIISVAALDSNNNLGNFSNWGVKTVDIGAPGVAVYSTVVQKEKYTDTVINMLGIKATWDGTSMATPHVAGAAALYWSAHPEKTWQEVKAAVLNSATPIPALAGKVSSNGKLNVSGMMAQ